MRDHAPSVNAVHDDSLWICLVMTLGGDNPQREGEWVLIRMENIHYQPLSGSPLCSSVKQSLFPLEKTYQQKTRGGKIMTQTNGFLALLPKYSTSSFTDFCKTVIPNRERNPFAL